MRGEGGGELSGGEGFEEEGVVEGDGFGVGTAAAHGEEEGGGAGLAEFAGERGAGGAGHLDVGEDDLRRVGGSAEEVECGVSGFGAVDGIAFGFEHDGEEFADHGVVVDDQDAEGLGRARHRWRRVSSKCGGGRIALRELCDGGVRERFGSVVRRGDALE